MDISINHYLDIISEKLLGWSEAFVAAIPNFIVAVLAIITFYYFAKLGKYLSNRVLSRFYDSYSVSYLFSRLIFFAIFLIGVVLALNVLNLEKAVTSLLAGAGIIGLALGFAFQDLSANLISGIFITFRRPFKVGDIVSTQNYLGKVEKIDLRVTTLQTFQGLHVLVPNRDVQNSPLVNYTKTEERRVDIELGVAYDSDLEQVLKLSKEVLNSLSFKLHDRDVGVYFKEFGSSSIDLQLQLWIKYDTEIAYLKSKSEAVMAIKKAFDKNNITIPFPIRTLDLSNHVKQELNKVTT